MNLLQDELHHSMTSLHRSRFDQQLPVLFRIEIWHFSGKCSNLDFARFWYFAFSELASSVAEKRTVVYSGISQPVSGVLSGNEPGQYLPILWKYEHGSDRKEQLTVLFVPFFLSFGPRNSGDWKRSCIVANHYT